jgi:4-amino-4-deoxy-L-arabinose transferase-like glycosyltransferase
LKPPGDGLATPARRGAGRRRAPGRSDRPGQPGVFLVWFRWRFFRPIGDFGVETDFYGELAYYARQWTQGHGGLMTGFRGPLYPILLGLLTLPFRDAFLVGKLLSVLGAALGLWLTGDLVRRRFGRVAGAVAALALAANTTFTDHAYRACTDLFYFALFAGTLWWLLRDDDDSDRRWIWAGVLGGAAWLTRYNGLALLPAGLLAAALGGHAPRRAARHALLFSLAMTLVAAPWAFYVWSQTGDPLWSNNYQNVALEVLGAALAQAGTFMAATDFRSVGEVRHVPARPAGDARATCRPRAGGSAAARHRPGASPRCSAGRRLAAGRTPGRALPGDGLLTYLSLVPIYYNRAT